MPKSWAGKDSPLYGVDLTRARRMYRTARDAADAFGVSSNAIRDAMRQQGLPPYPQTVYYADSDAGTTVYKDTYENPKRWFSTMSKRKASKIIKDLVRNR